MPSASSLIFFRLLLTCIKIRAIIAKIKEITPNIIALLFVVGAPPSTGPAAGAFTTDASFIYATILSTSVRVTSGNPDIIDLY